MSSPKKLPVGLLIKLAVVAVVLLAGAILLLRGVDVRGLVAQVFEQIRAAGPVVFFLAMCVLPAIGAPISAFYFAAGPAFGPTLGMPLVVLFSLLALAVNLAFTFWLAHKALRPIAEWLLGKFGYRVPQVTPENELSVAVLLRVTPGPPYFMQGFLVALAGVRFRTYMIVSFGVQAMMGIAFIVFGRAIMDGKGGLALLGLGLLGGGVVVVQMLRRKFAKRNADAGAQR